MIKTILELCYFYNMTGSEYKMLIVLAMLCMTVVIGVLAIILVFLIKGLCNRKVRKA